MRYLFFLLFFLSFFFSNAQSKDETKKAPEEKKSLLIDHSKDKPKAKINQYRIISLAHDTTFVDTSLTIKKQYKFNYLRKDNFGLLPFANEGQTYQILNFGYNQFSALPEMGFSAKHFNYYKYNDINYYSVATPLTDLYFKTVMEQGQSLEAMITINPSPNLNMSVSYKGLRSIGKYINQLSSSGNFVFTTSYHTTKNQYQANFHYTDQDVLNGENGGVINISDFLSGDKNYSNRARLAVFQSDAKSYLKGKRIFLDHSFKLNAVSKDNFIYLLHQFNYENKYFEFNQLSVTNDTATSFNNEFGASYVGTGLNDQTHYNKMYNKFGIAYQNMILGKFQFFAEDFRDNSYYYKVLFLDTQTVPSTISHKIKTIGGTYEYNKSKYSGIFAISKAISTQTISTIDANLKYSLNKNNLFSFQYQNISKLPNNNFSLYQSSYKYYNWSNNFNNEKINTIKITANTKYADAILQFTTLKDHLYFSNDSINRQIVTPKQYNETINYLSLQVNKEIRFRKFSLDNTLLFQEVKQIDKILNVPQITTRNTLYFNDYYFKKALYLQTGVTLNYFTKYYGDSYNPVTGEFFVQKTSKIGDFPAIDFFVNGRIRQTRIFFMAEHLNSLFSKSNYLTAPNYPYRDFIIRFGLVWNFFQ